MKIYIYAIRTKVLQYCFNNVCACMRLMYDLKDFFKVFFDLMCYDTYTTTFEHLKRHKLIAKIGVFMTYNVKY